MLPWSEQTGIIPYEFLFGVICGTLSVTSGIQAGRPDWNCCEGWLRMRQLHDPGPGVARGLRQVALTR